MSFDPHVTLTVVRDVVVTDLLADLFIWDEESRARGLRLLL